MVTRALAAAAALLLAGCDQFTSVSGHPLPALARPLVVMHRGGGAGNLDYRENTLPAILYGAAIYDGAEMDLQLSQDGTIWLGHDNKVHDCNVPLGTSFNDPVSGGEAGCFQGLGDAAIDGVAYCDTETALPCARGSTPTCVQRYVRLAEVFERFSTDPALLPEILALDVKDQLCGSFGIPESRDMANALHGLVTTYQMDWRLVVESDQPTFMDEFHAHDTPAYLFVEGYGPIDPIVADASQNGANGISYRYTNAPFDPTLPEGLRNVGLRVMVFAVPDPYDRVDQIAPVWDMKPDVIATDRPDFYDHVVLPAPF
jgi:glycerophosphoryl diester phosphodiesterase